MFGHPPEPLSETTGLHTGLTRADQFLTGDEVKIQKWFLSILESTLKKYQYFALSGWYFSQLGESSGNIIQFPWLPQISSLAADLGDFLTKMPRLRPDWEADSVSTQLVDLGDPGHISNPYLLRAPIIGSGLDGSQHIHGEIFVVTSTARFHKMSGDIRAICRLLASTIRSVYSVRGLYAVTAPIPELDLTQSTKKLGAFGKACIRTVGAKSFVYWKIRWSTQLLQTIAMAGSGADLLALDMRLNRGVAGKCAAERRNIEVKDLLDREELESLGISQLEHETTVRELGWRSAVFCPVMANNTTVGVMAVVWSRPQTPSDLDKFCVHAFAQRLSANAAQQYIRRELEALHERLDKEAPIIEAGIRATEIVHDVRNALVFAQNRINAITASFRRDKQSKIYSDAIEAANHIDTANQDLASITSSAKATAYHIRPHKLQPIVFECISGLKEEFAAIRAVCKITCDETLEVSCDRARIERVFRNLIDNSIFFLETDSKAGQRLIHLKCRELKEEVEILIEDNGPGISPVDIDRIFEYMYTTKGDRGMGFGLAIAKTIVERNHGSISVESDWGFGTVFRITLPFV